MADLNRQQIHDIGAALTGKSADEVFFDPRSAGRVRGPMEREYRDTPAEIYNMMRADYPQLSPEELALKVRRSMEFMTPREEREGGSQLTPEEILARVPAS